MTTAVAFDENAIGPSLVLTDGDFTLQTSAVVDAHRMARSAYGQSVAKSVVELYPYSPNLAAGLITTAPSITSVSGVPPLCVGFCDVSAALNDFLGHDAHGWGYCPGDGKVYNNNTVVATWTAAGLSATITITFDFNALKATFAANGTVLGQITLTASTAYYYAATVSGNPGDLAVWTNAGQSPLRYSPGGFYHANFGINPIYIATEPYITTPTDKAPNKKFSGDLDRTTTKLSIQRSLNFWPWGASAPPQLGKGGKLQFTILDPNEIYGQLLSNDIRDQLIIFNRVAQGASFDASEKTYTAIIDHCEQTSDQTKTIYGNDKLTLLQGQLYRPLFPPDADKSVAGKPRPLSLGVCRTYTPNLYDAKNFYFGASSDPITAVGQSRMQGQQMALGIDYTELADAEGFSLPTAPAGKWTLETTTYGGAFNVSYTDQLGGNGVFGSVAAQANGQPVNWTGGGGYPTDPTNTVWQVTGTAPNKFVRQPQKAFAIYWMEYTPPGGFTLAPGATVAFQVVLNQVPYYGPGVDTNGNPTTIIPAICGFGGRADNSIVFWAWGKFSAPRAGTYSGAITNTSSVALPLVFFFDCQSQIQGNPYSYLDVASIEIVPLPALTQTINFTKVPLDYMLQKLIGQYGALTLADYDPATAQAIDTATGYSYGLHVGPDKSLTVQAAVKQVLDSCCADAFVQNNGLIGVARLIAPENQTATATLTVTDFQGYLEPWPDLAENLTTRLSGAPQPDPYTEADLANQSQTTVPQSVRKLLEQPFQWTVVGGPVAPRYNHAVGASPLPSQLDQQADGQAEIKRLNALYAVLRNFYVGTVFTPLGKQYELGQIVNVTYPLETLKNGQNLMIVGLNE